MKKKKITALVLTSVLCLALCACGGGSSTAEEESGTDTATESAAEVNATTISLSDSIEADEFSMSFDSVSFVEQVEFQSGITTSETNAVEGYKYLTVSGHFANNSSGTISLPGPFALSLTVNNEYVYNDVGMSFDKTGGPWEIDALADSDFYIYASVPDKLVDIAEDFVLSIVFNDGLDDKLGSYDFDYVMSSMEVDNVYELVGSVDAITNESEAEEVTVEVTEEEIVEEAAEEVTLDADTLLAEIANQELTVISANYIVQDAQYKALYPDMLQAVIENNTAYDIKNAVIAFVAWDENNLPVKIANSYNKSRATYIKEVNYDDINLVPGDTFGEDVGYEVNENCGIVTVKAIVVSYEAFTGETWENPYYDDWCELYEGTKLD